MSTPDDTLRALKDLPYNAPTKCKFGFHKWSVWSLADVKDHYGPRYGQQYRTCVNCNIAQARSMFDHYNKAKK